MIFCELYLKTVQEEADAMMIFFLNCTSFFYCIPGIEICGLF